MLELNLRTIDTADEIAAPILKGFKEQYGMVPNFFAALGIDGGALSGYLDFVNSIEAHGQLNERQRELISLAVANYNGCHYCVSGHTFSAKRAGLSLEECAQAQLGQATDPYEQALLNLVEQLLEKQGHLEEQDKRDACDAGMTEQLVIQVAAWTALNTFSNWVNNIVQTKIDFPKVPLAQR
ncbi:carboxymuconolactone decarboxylase family protein [Oceanimonas baumannii]|uniref:carboxymuconolactone decarboxylase family protein n=1 Tax=Oceanimonas baumannii TaxID=129578 RepID=UPI001D18020D|nr:carboxymuconolactone decarboxylase family protein [Oceanimonas baumannii]MCC4262887.1 carboxymuconolactone decarboxylase family protein [Oceanimonas baumannii]